MLLEEKLRRAADWAGLLTSALGLLTMVGPAFGIAALQNLRLTEPSLAAATASCLVLAGASLLVSKRRATRAARHRERGAGLDCRRRKRGQHDVRGVHRGGRTVRRRGGGPAVRQRAVAHGAPARAHGGGAAVPAPAAGPPPLARVGVAASAVIAGCVAAMLGRAFSHTGELAATLDLAPRVAFLLCVLGTGILLAGPDERPVRILFERTAVGALARRLFLGVAVMPVFFSGLLAVLLRDRRIGLVDGVLLLAVTLVLAGFAVALFSVETAVGIDDRREEAEQAQLLLTARLQEQAAQLQETVGRRTRELHEVNANLRAAAESNARLALVAHHTNNGVIITDAEGRFEWVNAAFEHMTGYSLAEIQRRKPGSLLQGPGTDPAAIGQLRHARVHGEACKVEILNYTKLGRPFWQVVEIQPVRDDAGQVINFISIQTDVTEQRAAAQRQHALNQRLRLATRAAALGVWEWEAATQKSFWDDRTLEIYGLTRDQFTGTHEDWTGRLHPTIAVARAWPSRPRWRAPTTTNRNFASSAPTTAPCATSSRAPSCNATSRAGSCASPAPNAT